MSGRGYRVESIGNARRSIEAKVISTRPVFIALGESGAGSLAGGVAGGSIAAHNSNNTAVIIAGIIGGIIGGMIVGRAFESASDVRRGTEYVILTSPDAVFVVAQLNAGNLAFAERDNVVLVYGFPCRLVAG